MRIRRIFTVGICWGFLCAVSLCAEAEIPQEFSYDAGSVLTYDDFIVYEDDEEEWIAQYGGNVLDYFGGEEDASEFLVYASDKIEDGSESDRGKICTFRGINPGTSSVQELIDAYGIGLEYEYDKETDPLRLGYIDAGEYIIVEQFDNIARVFGYFFDRRAQIMFYITDDDIVSMSYYVEEVETYQIPKSTIQMVQNGLNERGYDCGAADGIAGQNTENAIIAYQHDHGLFESGAVDDHILKAFANDPISGYKTNDNQNDQISTGVSLNIFVTRYNECVSYLKEAQGVSIKDVTADTFTNNDGVAPNNNLKFCVNPNTEEKDPVGIINIWGDNANIDSAKALGEVVALFYAFDESITSPDQAVSLFGELTEGDGRVSRNGIDYTNLTTPGIIGFKGEYAGYR